MNAPSDPESAEGFTNLGQRIAALPVNMDGATKLAGLLVSRWAIVNPRVHNPNILQEYQSLLTGARGVLHLSNLNNDTARVNLTVLPAQDVQLAYSLYTSRGALKNYLRNLVRYLLCEGVTTTNLVNPDEHSFPREPGAFTLHARRPGDRYMVTRSGELAPQLSLTLHTNTHILSAPSMVCRVPTDDPLIAMMDTLYAAAELHGYCPGSAFYLKGTLNDVA